MLKISYLTVDYQISFYTGPNILLWKFKYAEVPPNQSDKVEYFLILLQVAKCDYRRFGPSGTIETLDTICVLPINVINEKIYIVLWFWLIFVAVVSAFYNIFLVLVALCPYIRVAILKSRFFVPVKHEDIVSAIQRENMSWLQELGDWLVLDMVFWNLDKWTNREILRHINRDWKKTPSKTFLKPWKESGRSSRTCSETGPFAAREERKKERSSCSNHELSESNQLPDMLFRVTSVWKLRATTNF